MDPKSFDTLTSRVEISPSKLFDSIYKHTPNHKPNTTPDPDRMEIDQDIKVFVSVNANHVPNRRSAEEYYSQATFIATNVLELEMWLNGIPRAYKPFIKRIEYVPVDRHGKPVLDLRADARALLKVIREEAISVAFEGVEQDVLFTQYQDDTGLEGAWAWVSL